MISPASRAGASSTATISWPAPAAPTVPGVDAQVAQRELVDRLGLGGHDPLEAGVAGLDDAGGHRDERGQRRLDLVVAELGLALDLDLAVAVDLDLLGEGDRGEAEEGGDLLGDRAGVAVARLGGREHQVGLGPLDGGGQHLGGVEGARARQGVVGHQDRLGGAHGQRGAQAGDLVVGGHGDEGDLAAAGLVDKLESHLDAVAVGLVEDQLAAAVEGVVGLELPGLGRVRDLLHAYDDVHDRHAARDPGNRPNRPRYK